MTEKIHTLTYLPGYVIYGRDPIHEILPSEAVSGRLVWHLKVSDGTGIPNFRVLIMGYQDFGLGPVYSSQTQLGVSEWFADPNSPDSDVSGELQLSDLSMDVVEAILQFGSNTPQGQLSVGARLIYQV